MAYEIPGFSFSLPSNADYSDGSAKGKFVTVVNSSGVAQAKLVATAGGAAIGVCQNSPASGEAMTIVCSGVVIVSATGDETDGTTDSAIAAGDSISSTAAGLGSEGKAANSDIPLGVALSPLAAGAQGDITVLLTNVAGSAFVAP